MNSASELIQRFHGALVDSIRTEAPSYLRDTFTVAEIYQSLVPYRTHRDLLGIEMNGDYEDALLRLLAGEGEFLVLESEPARNRIRRELEHKNPNTGIYREFAAAEVRLNPERIPDEVEVPAQGPEEQTSFAEFAGPGPGRPDAGGASGLDEIPAERPKRPEEPTPDVPAEASDRPTHGGEADPDRLSSCPECEGSLPARSSLQFCPHCGINVLEIPCPECGETLERGWAYCVACGTPTRG